jgi:sarcosine oxidase gamma subunit
MLTTLTVEGLKLKLLHLLATTFISHCVVDLSGAKETVEVSARKAKAVH